MNDYVSLADVHKRALEVNAHKAGPARDALITAIAAERGIRCYSKEIVVFESSYCWVFHKMKMPILHNQLNDDDTNLREKEAYNIAYKISPKPSDVEVIRGGEQIFVFTEMEKTHDGSSIPMKIRIFPNIIPNISDDYRCISFRTTENRDIEVKTRSRYWSNEHLIIVNAKDVTCLRSDVDRCFPYSTANPTRGKRGRPSHKSTIFEYLDLNYGICEAYPRTAQIANEMMDSFAQRGVEVPARSTCMKFVKDWLEEMGRKESEN